MRPLGATFERGGQLVLVLVLAIAIALVDQAIKYYIQLQIINTQF